MADHVEPEKVASDSADVVAVRRLEDLPPVLTPDDVAHVIKLHRDTVYDLIVARKLRATNIGLGRRATYRVLREDLIAYVRGDTDQGAEHPLTRRRRE